MLHDVRVPDLDMPECMMRLTLWMARPGQTVEEDRPVAEILAGAVLFELPAPVQGILAERLVEEDDLVTPGQTIGRIESE